ncbi:MAG TPA: cytochrome c [Candidatus Angelobacter sp.]|nr:cytochrome c [Candidatus Angelobacter sp.]
MPSSLRNLRAAATLLLAGGFICLGLLAPISGPAYAADQKGSESKGRYYFRQTCKNCHTKGAAGGEITPLNKTQVQWKAYFLAGKHAKGKEALAKVMDPVQLRDVAAFLHEHAADSLQPETCGK